MKMFYILRFTLVFHNLCTGENSCHAVNKKKNLTLPYNFHLAVNSYEV